MSEAPARGNFIAGLNRGKEMGSKDPDFTGRLGVPGREHEHRLVLWTHRDSRGRAYFAGSINGLPIDGNALAQIERLADQHQTATGEVLEVAPNLELGPRQVILFPNGFKEPQATDTPEEAEKRAKRPDFWGRLNPGDGTPPVALSVWLRTDRYQNPLLTGSTGYPIPGRRDGLDEQAPDQASADTGRRSRRRSAEEGVER
ncbi:hypothetical protein KKP04_11060 [Rhodomicrobium sp. Az07]|uniref:hypothetical protein n=1 Tax=Rhodomicrobium sp. Az07 TaxID=2839034 RepID=UPI001BEA9966|nr:hypothetical protein [Rhodomicrobium sp. Az07]MBT3071402.1 hypothetical protein [Rhodomicrobium sp. Az07]